MSTCPKRKMYRINIFYKQAKFSFDAKNFVCSMFVNANSKERAEQLAIERINKLVEESNTKELQYNLITTISSQDEMNFWLEHRSHNNYSGVVN